MLKKAVRQIRVLPKNDRKCTRQLSGPVAQVVEQLTFNQWVEGSNPSGLTNYPNNIIAYFMKTPPLCAKQGFNYYYLSMA